MENYSPIHFNDSHNSYEETLKLWIDDVKAANEFIEVIHKLWYDNQLS